MQTSVKVSALLLATVFFAPSIAESKAKPKWKEKMEAEQLAQNPSATQSKPGAKSAPAAATGGEKSAPASKQGGGKFPFYVFTEKGSKLNHFSPSGWMGDYGDLKISDAYRVNPKAGETCIQISYSAMKRNGAGWAGVYWQEPANNWGNSKGGFDLTGAKKLRFWARGEKGGETIAEFKMGGIAEQSQPGDSTAASIGPITLTKEWQEYTIDLSDKDLSYIIGGFAWAASSEANPSGFVIYVDEIVYE